MKDNPIVQAMALALAIFAAFMGYALMKSWTVTHTTMLVLGTLLILAVAAAGIHVWPGIFLQRQAGQSLPAVMGPGAPSGSAAQELEFYRLAAARFKHADQMAERGLLIAQQEPEGVGRWAVTGGAWPTTAGENGGIE